LVKTQIKEKTAVEAQGINWGSIGILWFSTLAASGLISAYVLALAWFNIDGVESDPLAKAGGIATNGLANLSVFDPAFGYLGLEDNVSGAKTNGVKIRRFNTAYSLLQQALLIDRQYHLPALQKQVNDDLSTLQKLKIKLIALLNEEVSQRGQTYNQVRKSLSYNTRSGRRLTALTISLGMVSVVSQDSQASKRKKAKTLITEATLVAPEQFKPVAADVLPGAILITADYVLNSGKQTEVSRRREICLLLSSANQANNNSEPSCMVLDFPQGRPRIFNSLADLFKSDKFSSHGEWQQTTRGPVPGSGSLAPPAAPVLVDMNGRDCLSVVFYHWLRQLGAATDASKLAAVINATWPKTMAVKSSLGESSKIEKDETDILTENIAWQARINSCLAADSEARALAFLHQTAPQEAGQKALRQCFSNEAIDYPSSALPIIVDTTGNAITPGRTKFERLLTTDLLTEIYGTNLAAQDTIATAHLVELASHKALRDTRDRVFLKQADLASMKDSVRTEADRAKSKTLNADIAALETGLEYEQAEQKRSAIILSFAQTAKNNAYLAARQSFELSNRLMQVCRSGISRLDANTLPGAFLLGKRFIFSPQLVALSESEIFEQSNLEIEKPGSSSQRKSPWLQDKLMVFGKVHDFTKTADTKIFAEGRALSEMLAEDLPVLPAPAETIVYDSRALTSSSPAAPQSLSDYPFKSLPVNENQLIFYAQKALNTGMVSWSVLARDYVARHEESGRSGQPVPSSMHGWCRREGLLSAEADCPALACEWQLRAPLVLLDEQMKNALQGATLTDSKTGQRMPQVPPVDFNLM